MITDVHSFSVIVPAHNEETCLGACLRAVEKAASRVQGRVECIVVLNACTDGTERVAREAGATVTFCRERNLAAVRNTGAKLALNDILVTIDADSRMSANALLEVEKALASGKYIGGGVPIIPDRYSLGIVLTGVVLATICLAVGVPSAGMFWCFTGDFDAIGGFDESRHSGEDIDFAQRLKRYGRRQNKRFGTLRRAMLRTSCRKFDQFGDWFFMKLLLRHPRGCWRALKGSDSALAERLWYGVRR